MVVILTLANDISAQTSDVLPQVCSSSSRSSSKRIRKFCGPLYRPGITTTTTTATTTTTTTTSNPNVFSFYDDYGT